MTGGAHLLWIVASGFGTLVIAVLIVVYRRAAANREAELADELLDAEIDAISSSAPEQTGRAR